MKAEQQDTWQMYAYTDVFLGIVVFRNGDACDVGNFISFKLMTTKIDA